MTALIEIGLTNAPMALCLACGVYAIGRFWKQPALLHTLWVLVLLKLLMPPMIQVPVRCQLPAWIEAIAQEQGFRSGLMTSTANSLSSSSARSITDSSFKGAPQAALETASGDARSWQFLGLVENARTLFLILLGLWAFGSIYWYCTEGWRIVRFAQVFLRHARLAPKSMQRQAACLAREMGLKRCPEVWLLSAVVSPMLWCVGGRSRILFPSRLLAQLDRGAVATLLTHELAHYYRGDHWVRMLEFVTTGLFWWHPAVWMARREIEIHEEQCCDAWVVSQFPKSPRQYANALLATIDFLSEDHTVLPASVSPLGSVPLIRQRLILIMRGVAPKSLCFMGRITVAAMALVVFIQPRVSFPSLSPRPRGSDSSVSDTLSPHRPFNPVRKKPFNSENQNQSKTHQTNSIRSQPRPAQSSSSIKVNESRKSTRSAAGSGLALRPIPVQSQPIQFRPIQFQPAQFQPARFQKEETRRSLGVPLVPAGRFETKSTFPAQKAALPAVPALAGRTDWLVWAIATAPNLLSRIVAHTNGTVLWQHFCSNEVIDLSEFDINMVAYTPDGQWFVGGCRDGTVRVWDSSTGKLLRTLNGHHGGVRAVAISPLGNWMASGDLKGEVRLWSVLGDAPSEVLSNYCGPISSLAFSGDGQTVAVAMEVQSPEHLANLPEDETQTDCISGFVAFWSLLDRVELRKIEHTSPLAVLAFSLDSSCLSGAELSGRILTWDVDTTDLLGTRYLEKKTVVAAAFASQSELIRTPIGELF